MTTDVLCFVLRPVIKTAHKTLRKRLVAYVHS